MLKVKSEICVVVAARGKPVEGRGQSTECGEILDLAFWSSAGTTARLRKVGAVVAFILSSSCGDPRIAFVGTYSGPLLVTVRDSSGSQTFPHGEITVVLTAPKNSTVVEFDGKCRFTADVVASDKLSINKKACPTERVEIGTASAPLQCDLTETVNSGVGTLTGTTLSLSLTGDSQLTRCTGGVSGIATYTSTATLTRK
jgi:hypothetical protein